MTRICNRTEFFALVEILVGSHHLVVYEMTARGGLSVFSGSLNNFQKAAHLQAKAGTRIHTVCEYTKKAATTSPTEINAGPL